MRYFVCIVLFVASALSALEPIVSPSDAKVYILTPQDGQRVSQDVRVVFGLRGMGVAPAGVRVKNTGHHHLLLNYEDELPEVGIPMPATEQLLHFGKGQTETILHLKPGRNTLQLMMGDFAHRPHLPAVYSEKIEVWVE